MSGYSVNITNTRNNSLIYQTTIPSNHENNTAFFMWSLVNQSLIAQECNTLRISVSAVNVAYGESEPAQTDVKLLKGKINDVLKSCMIATIFVIIIKKRKKDLLGSAESI